MSSQFNRKKDIIGLDFAGEKLAISHLKVKGGKEEFLSLLHYSIEGLNEDDLAKIILKAFKDLKVKNPYVVNIVPLHLTITKNLEIPSLDPQEIKEIIDLQSGRQTPYSREEIIVDYINIGTYKRSYTKILLVIVTRSAIKKQYDIMLKAGINIEKIVFAPEGITRVCLSKINKELHDVPVGIVHVDSSFTDFLVSLRGGLIFTRSIPIGIKQLGSDKEKFEEKFFEELKSSLETYQSEDIEVPPQLLLITGATDTLADLNASVAKQIPIPVKVVSYLDCLPFNPKKAVIPATTKNISFFNVTAVFLAFESLRVNLIPEEIKLKRAFEQRTQELMKMSFYIIFLLILLGAFFLSRLYFKGMYIERLKLQNQATRDQAQILEKAMERIRIIKYYHKNRGCSLEIISAIYDLLPNNIMLTSIKMDTEKNLHLKGTGRAMSNVFTFVNALEKSEFFSNVKTNYTTSRKEKDEDWADFGVSCVIEIGKEY